MIPPPPARPQPSSLLARWGGQALAMVLAALPLTLPAAEPPSQLDVRPPWAVAAGSDRYGTWADLTVGGVTQRLRLIGAGTFAMGSEEGEAEERPVHQVVISRPFWLGDSPVTQGLWRVVMGGNPSQFTGDDRRPVDGVSWDDGDAFFRKLDRQIPGLNASYPTEAQWEYACRAGTREHPGTLEERSWYSKNADGQTHLVKTKAANAWGLYDMCGNVLNWCADWYGEYAYPSVTDPAGPRSGTRRILRGGAWAVDAMFCTATGRSSATPDQSSNRVGLRLAIP